MTITKEKFNAIKAIRESAGATNMPPLSVLPCLTGLEPEEIVEIICNYEKYNQKFTE